MKLTRPRIGLRTLKTAAAVILSILIVDSYGATTSKVILAMLGAMAAVQTTFTESLESCLTQIVGVLFGALVGIILLLLPLPALAATGIGIVLVITLYNAFQIRFSPGLPCLIVVTLCMGGELDPVAYATGRIWDTAIGLGVGMLINTLVFPYDNSRQLRQTMNALDTELIRFLEEMFDGDEELPDVKQMESLTANLARQLQVFSNQKLLLHLSRQKRQIETFRLCESKARELLARMEILSHVGRLGRLDEENRRRLNACGANIRDMRPLDAVQEKDVVTNYHVRQILTIRRELLEALGKMDRQK